MRWWIALALSSCSRGTEERIIVTGSSTVAPLMAEIGKRFEAEHPGVRVDVQSGGSSRGISDARAAVAHIGMVSRALKEDERDLSSFSIARDGIAIIVHQSNPVRSLSSEQIREIYSGQITSWKEVGGKDEPITVVNKAEGRSTLELFSAHFQLESAAISAHVVIGDNEQGVKTVAGNPNAVGYVSIGTAELDVSLGVAIALLPLDGIAASIANVKNESFPLSRPLNLVTRSKPEGRVEELIDFARSEKVHDIVRRQYFVPVER